MLLIIVSLVLWQGFKMYMSQRMDIYIGQFLPVLMVIGVLNGIGLIVIVRLKTKVMKYLLVTIHLLAIGWSMYASYQIVEVGGGFMNVIRQIEY